MDCGCHRKIWLKSYATIFERCLSGAWRWPRYSPRRFDRLRLRVVLAAEKRFYTASVNRDGLALQHAASPAGYRHRVVVTERIFLNRV
jgi:hypothetical protein